MHAVRTAPRRRRAGGSAPCGWRPSPCNRPSPQRRARPRRYRPARRSFPGADSCPTRAVARGSPSRLVTAMTLTTSSPKAPSPVNAAVGGARSGAALIHRPVERTLHCAPTVNDPRLVCSIRPCRCLALSRWFCGFEWRSGTQCGQPVSRPLGQRLLPRIRCDSHVRRCEAHSRYCSRWTVDFQMAVLLALDRNGFGLCRERYRARALSGSRRGSLPQGPIPSAFKGYGSARRGVNAIAVRVHAVNAAGAGESAEVTGTPRDGTAPALSRATLNGATLTPVFDEALDEDSRLAAQAFAVEVNATARGVDTVVTTLRAPPGP